MTGRSIKHKLTLVSMGTTTAALLLACLLFLAYDFVTFRHLEIRALETLGTTIGAGSTAALTFADPATAREALAPLASYPNVTYAGVHDVDGELFAEYVRAQPTTAVPEGDLPPPGHYISWTYVDVVQPIVLAGERIGVIMLRASRDAQYARIQRFVWVAAVIIVTAWIVAFVVTSRLQRMVSEPVLRLAYAAGLVSRDRNYGLRVARTTDDEVGELVSAFNHMLEEIQRQDVQLRRHRATLEEQVTARTAELITANEHLERSRDRAEQANRAKSDFLANMSHEIRTPMNGVIGMIDLTIDSGLSAEQREQLAVAKTSAESLLRVVNDVLDLSKIEAGRLELDETTFVLRELVEEAVRTAGVGARVKGIALECTVDDEVSVRVTADAGRLRQVLVNLVSNAVKFTDHGHVSVRAWLERADDGTVLLHGVVSDTGIGIPADKQALIFDAFTQADGSTTRRFGGTGLGLTISARLMALMGGRLTVQSTEGQGSAFHFSVNVALPEARPAEVAEAPAVASGGAPPSPGQQRLRVLLVEDNLVNQRVGQGMLRKAGHAVQIAANGRECLDMLADASFDLVCMDMQMPVMGGLDAIAAIRAREREQGGHLPIIAVTAHALEGDRGQFLAAGADGYVAKPITLDTLTHEIEEVLVRIGTWPSVAGPVG